MASTPRTERTATRSRTASWKVARLAATCDCVLSGDLLPLILAHIDPMADSARHAEVCTTWSRFVAQQLDSRRMLRREAVYGGTRGAGDGELQMPSHVAALPSGDGRCDILISDTYNDRCIRMTTSGEFAGYLHECVRPRGLAVDGHAVYVGEFTNHRICRLALRRNGDIQHGPQYGHQGSASTDAPALMGPWYPEGCAISSRWLFCADSKRHRIVVYEKTTLRFVRAFGSRGSGDGELISPCGVAIGPGTASRPPLVFVCDKGNHRISIFTRSGAFVRTIGRFGSQPGSFRDPHSIVFAHGRMYVSESAAHRVQAFSFAGRPAGEVQCSGERGSLGGICAVGPMLYVADASNHAIHCLRALISTATPD